MKGFLPGTLVSLAFLALFCLALIPNEATAAAAKEQDHKDDPHAEPHDQVNGEAAQPEGHPEPGADKDHDDDKTHAAAKAEPEPEAEPESDHHSGEDNDDNGASHVGIAPVFLFLPLLALVFQR